MSNNRDSSPGGRWDMDHLRTWGTAAFAGLLMVAGSAAVAAAARPAADDFPTPQTIPPSAISGSEGSFKTGPEDFPKDGGAARDPFGGSSTTTPPTAQSLPESPSPTSSQTSSTPTSSSSASPKTPATANTGADTWALGLSGVTLIALGSSIVVRSRRGAHQS